MGDSTTYNHILVTGTYSNYLAIVSKDPNKLYFCSDVKKIYKGDDDYTDSFVPVLAANLPSAADAIPGKIYYITDENKFKTKIGNELVDLSAPVDKVGSNTTSNITVSSLDDHVPSSKDVYIYGQEILGQATGGSGIVKAIAASDATDGAFVVEKGDLSTYTVVVPNVFTGVAADAETAGKINFSVSDDTEGASVTVPGVVTGIANTTTGVVTVTPSTGSAYDVTFTGLVGTPSWDSTALKLTLPVVGGQDVEVNIPKDIFLKSGTYDATNKKIVLTLNDASESTIEFSVEDLIPIYESTDTVTAATGIDWDATNGKHIISVDVKISDDVNNAITTDASGLIVDKSNFATTDELATLEGSVNNLATAALTWGTF